MLSLEVLGGMIHASLGFADGVRFNSGGRICIRSSAHAVDVGYVLHEHVMPPITAVHHSTIANLYFALLGRSPNIGVFEYWSRSLADGVPLIAIARTFLDAAENEGIYPPEMTDDEFVKKLYCASAGRIAQLDTVRHWVGVLGSCRKTYRDGARAAVAVALVEMLAASARLRG